MKFLGHIFDLDGTLAHTMPLHFTAWQEALTPLEMEFSIDRFYSLGGVPTIRIVELLAQEQGKDIDPTLVTEQKEQLFASKLNDIKPIEAVKAIAEEHRGKTPMAVATGSNRQVALRVLTDMNILDWFDAVVTADDIINHKPAPDTFLIAAKKIGVEPRFCCAYEDTDLGLEAIAAAGMHGIDVRPLYPEA